MECRGAVVMNFLENLLHWNFFLKATAFLFFLDWVFYLPIFKSLFAFEQGSTWKARPEVLTILAAGGWLVSIGLAGLGPEPLRALGWGTLWVIFRLLFIKRRWSSVRRGCGAPGFMSHWAALWIFLVEMARLVDGTGWLVSQIFAALRLDFALIMLCAGTYKAAVGFMRGNGMEFGRVNPIWGYHWSYFSKKSPTGLYPKIMNILAAGGEIAAGVLLLVPHPWIQMAGVLVVSLSFLYVSFFIRLGRLAWLMVLLPALYLPEVLEGAQTGAPVLVQLPLSWLVVGAIPFWIFMGLLPFLKLTQYYNLFANRTLPRPLQEFFTVLADRIPVIVWRVFTPDVINFFVRISVQQKDVKKLLVGESGAYSYRDWSNPWLKLRFLNVTESIALVSVFTTLKYFPSKLPLFEERLLRYAQSVAADLSTSYSQIEFEYVAILKNPHGWIYHPACIFLVDLATNTISKQVLDPKFDLASPALFSPVRESIRPGSLEPLAAT